MVVKKAAKPRKRAAVRAKNWREAIRFHLAKVREVDAVYVSTASGTVHVYSVVESFHKTDYPRLLREEDRIEKAFPEISFEFHTQAHQGRKPTGKEPYTSDLVFLRSNSYGTAPECCRCRPTKTDVAAAALPRTEKRM